MPIILDEKAKIDEVQDYNRFTRCEISITSKISATAVDKLQYKKDERRGSERSREAREINPSARKKRPQIRK